MRALAALAALTVLAGCSSAPQGAATRPLRMRKPRAAHSATLMDDGHVLLAGGCTSERCRPVQTARAHHGAIALEDRVLVLGGENGAELDSAEVYDGEVRSQDYRTWTPVGAMAAARSDIAGSVSRATGLDPVVAGDAPAIERYDVIAKRFATVAPSGARPLATATALRSTETLVAGGFDRGTRPSAAAALIAP